MLIWGERCNLLLKDGLMTSSRQEEIQYRTVAGSRRKEAGVRNKYNNAKCDHKRIPISFSPWRIPISEAASQRHRDCYTTAALLTIMASLEAKGSLKPDEESGEPFKPTWPTVYDEAMDMLKCAYMSVCSLLPSPPRMTLCADLSPLIHLQYPS